MPSIRGAVERVRFGVYRIAGAPVSWEQQALRGLLRRRRRRRGLVSLGCAPLGDAGRRQR